MLLRVPQLLSERCISPDGSDLQFYTVSALGNTPVLAMTIDKSQRVGIGNSNPSHRLSVAGTANNVNSEITITATSVASAYIGANANGLNLGTDTAGIVFKTGVTGGGSVGSTGTERMRFHLTVHTREVDAVSEGTQLNYLATAGTSTNLLYRSCQGTTTTSPHRQIGTSGLYWASRLAGN